MTGRDSFTPSSDRLDHTNDPDNHERNELLQTDLIRRKAQLYDMENNIPKPSGTYLKIILGNINVSILNKEEKWVADTTLSYSLHKDVLGRVCG